MNEEIQEIKIVGIDKEGITKDDSFPHAYKLPFILSTHPNTRWVHIFEKVYYGQSLSSREASISGNRIIVIMSDDERIANHKHKVEQAVNNTNDEYIRICQEQQQKQKQKQERLEYLQEEQEDTINKLRKDAEGLKF